ncbi:hypothetical protein UlMin_000521 [Ulmus minor]
MEVSIANGIATKASPPHPPRRRNRRKIYTCAGVVLAVILLVVIVAVILSQTVFKAKDAVIAIDAVKLKDLDLGFGLGRLAITLNITLGVDLSIENPNKLGFRYDNSTAAVNYRGGLIGEVPILGDKISAGETKPMNITLTIMVDRLLSNSQMYSDVVAGVLPLNTYTRIRGSVKILGIKIHAVSTSSCDFEIFIGNRTTSEQRCRYTTKL